jgi:hypothetical protein
MASWAPRLGPERRGRRTTPHHGRLERRVLRLGGHVVADQDLVRLAERLGQIQDRLAGDDIVAADEGGNGRLQALARECVARDLELLTSALHRSRVSGH